MMEAKTKKTLIIWGVILLVALNVTSLSTIWYHRYQYSKTSIDRRYHSKAMSKRKKMVSKRSTGRTNYMSRGLDLTTAQQDKFDSIWNHYSSIRRDVEQEMEQNRQAMSGLMSAVNIDTNQFNELSAVQGILMQELDHSMINMNLALRTTLNDEQLKTFLAKVETMRKRMRPHTQVGEKRRMQSK